MSRGAVDVAVVGGGPAGALVAMLLARAGREVVVLERAPRWRWRACGVFASPASVAALRRLGVGERELIGMARPVPALRVESVRGTAFALSYGGTGALADSAVGFDRHALDTHLLRLARAAGATVREGVTVQGVRLGAGVGDGHAAGLDIAGGDRVAARVVIGADGLRSVVARTAGVSRPSPLGPRAALTFHVPDAAPGGVARLVVIEDGYIGLAPVPGDRVNAGIVLGRSWFARLRREGGGAVARRILSGALGVTDPEDARLRMLDRVAGVTPLGAAVARRAGPGWLLVGDAAGFLDPFTGEGIHRAVTSAELAAEAIDATLDGRPGAHLEHYDGAMRSRFRAKDLVSRLVHAFLARPALFEYTARRLAAREQVRETMGLVIGDLAPAARALDPRYLVTLLAP